MSQSDGLLRAGKGVLMALAGVALVVVLRMKASGGGYAEGILLGAPIALLAIGLIQVVVGLGAYRNPAGGRGEPGPSYDR